MHRAVVAELDVQPEGAVRVAAAVFPGLVGLIAHGFAAIVELHHAPGIAEQGFDPGLRGLTGNDFVQRLRIALLAPAAVSAMAARRRLARL